MHENDCFLAVYKIVKMKQSKITSDVIVYRFTVANINIKKGWLSVFTIMKTLVKGAGDKCGPAFFWWGHLTIGNENLDQACADQINLNHNFRLEQSIHDEAPRFEKKYCFLAVYKLVNGRRRKG